MSAGEFFGALIYIVGVVLPMMNVLRRIGYSRWWGLIALVPLVNVVMMWVLVSAQWPIEERLRDAEWAAQQASANP
jgi:hypothetical protein